MKIYDCFLYFDEELLLDLRLNCLNRFVDKFVIVESKFSHRGEKRKPTFDIKKFSKFREKITYILLENEPNNLSKIHKDDSKISEKIIAESRSNLLIGCNVISELSLLSKQRFIKF